MTISPSAGAHRRPALTGWLGSCCLAALALAAPGIAQARGFAGTSVVVQGDAQIVLGATQTSIDVRTPQAVINWLEDSGTPPSVFPEYTQDFLPFGSSATFTGSNAAAGGYTVLNRLLLTGRAAFNGSVQSTVGGNPGGEVWFYSPNGIYLGPTATFSVGSLVLTANDIDTAGGLYGPGGEIRFRSVPLSKKEVVIAPGAQVSALGNSAYLAVVAPAIEQRGQITANGSIALVAAERAEITINAGLLDIEIIEGTTALNGIIHSGTTGGPVNGGPQAIQLVAITKNQAMTMLLSGTIGYQAATQAEIDGTAVVLTADSALPGGGASMQMGFFGDLRITAPLSAYAAKDIEVAPQPFRQVDFQSAATLTAPGTVTLSAVGATEINAAAGIAIRAGRAGQGGSVNVIARRLGDAENDIGRIAVSGLLDIDASGTAATGNGTGGTVFFDAAAGRMAFDAVRIDASGTSASGGIGQGGSVLVRARRGGAIASGTTAISTLGTNSGGTVTVRSAGGDLTLGDGAIDVSGLIRGGTVRLEAISGTHEWDDLVVDANGTDLAGDIRLAIAPGQLIQAGGNAILQAAGGGAPGNAGIEVTGQGGKLALGGFARLLSSRDIVLDLGPTGTIDVSALLTATSSGGAIRSTGQVTAGSLDWSALSGITATSLSSGATTVLRSAAGAVAVADLRSIGPVTAEAGSVDLASSGSLTVARAAATNGGIAISAAGNLIANNVDTAGTVDLDAGGSLDIGTLRGGVVSLAAGGAFGLGELLNATGALTVTSGGTAAFSGLVSAPTIDITSADIAIGTGSAIGAIGATSTITLSKAPAVTSAAIGNGGPAASYRLASEELAALHADQAIAVLLPFADPSGTVNLGSASASFGPQGNIAAGGALRIQTNGDLAVAGDVTIASLSAADRFVLSARNIVVEPASGSIVMRSGGSAGDLQGRLEMTAGTITAATPTVRTAIAGAGAAAITTALSQPAATGAAASGGGGFFQAAQIDAGVTTGLFIQNTGSGTDFAARRGFTANALTITTGPNAVVAINGRGTASGALGLDTAQIVTINGQPAAQAQGVDPRSSINGCVLGSDCRTVTPPDPDPPFVIRPPLSIFSGENIDGALDGNSSIDITHVPRIREPLSMMDGISLLDRNDTLLPEDGLDSLLDRGLAPGAPRLPGSDARPGGSELSREDDVLRRVTLLPRSLLPYLAYYAQLDPARQNPLIDEPVTGVGNDDLWLDSCGADPRDQTCGGSADNSAGE